MTTGSAQGVINTSSVEQLRIPIPSRNEQVRLLALIDELEDEAQRLESLNRQKLERLEALKQSLLHAAFTGHL